MKLINKSTRNYIACNIILEAGKVLEVKDDKAIKLFLKQEAVEEYVDIKEIEKLKKEIQELKAKETKDEGKEPEAKTKNTKNKKNK